VEEEEEEEEEWGALSKEGGKLGRWKAIIGFPVSSPRALIKR
jgi:hypothetical protein